jgi:tetratricopeptide (TPR) repeat protein
MNKILNFKILSTLIPILLCIVAILIYSANINGEFVFDDFSYFIGNDIITTISPFDFTILFNTATNLWGEVLPFRDFLYIIQYKAFGSWTTGYHMVSLFLFVCTYIVLFKLILILVKNHTSFEKMNNKSNHIIWLITLLISSVFLFHPIYVETFNYISGQKDALSLLFILLSVYFFYKAGRLESKLILCLTLGIFFHYIAMLSKISALSSIAFIPIFLLITSNQNQKRKYLLIALWLLANIPVILWVFHIIGLANSQLAIVEGVSFLERIPRAFNIIGCQVTHIFKPWPLNFGYPFNINWSIDMYFILGVLFTAVFSVLAILKRNKIILLGFILFILYLLPTLSIYPDMNNDKVYDRYLAAPFIGILIALIPVISYFLSKNRLWKMATIGFFFLIFSVLGFLTSLYVPVFQNQLNASHHTYTYFPSKKYAFFNYLNKLIDIKEYDRAEEVLNNAGIIETENGEKNYMLGRIQLEKGNLIKAIEFYRLSSNQSSLSGNYNYADKVLWEIYVHLKRYQEAEQVLKKIINDNQSPIAVYRAKSMLQEMEQMKWKAQNKVQ